MINSKIEPLEKALTLSWEKPKDGPVTGYSISLDNPLQPDPEIRILSHDKISVTFSNLDDDSVYVAKILTLSGNEESDEVVVEGRTLQTSQQESESKSAGITNQTSPTLP